MAQELLKEVIKRGIIRIIDIDEATNHLFALVGDALHGNEVLITVEGQPVAKLGPVKLKKTPRKFGVLKGKIKIAKDFDAPLSDFMPDGHKI